MKFAGIVPVFCAMLLVASCSDQPKEGWYEESVEFNEERDQYIQSQVDAGIDPAQARRDFDRKVMVEKTEGKE